MSQIEINQVEYKYSSDTPFESTALNNISLKFEAGTYNAIVGHTGSGKSTLIQLIDGLIKPSTGTVKVGDYLSNSNSSNKDLEKLRKKVGIVFQFPESQLFEETVIQDIAFGPKNFGKTNEEALLIAKNTMKLVGLDEELEDKSPFDLSGGQMRRVAIAGVLALEPEVLILDEPIAGLDAIGQRQIMGLFKQLHDEQGITIILVSHNMEDVAKYAENVVVLNQGHIVRQGSTREVFSDATWLTENHLNMPETVRFGNELQLNGFQLKSLPLTIDELADAIILQVKGGA